MSDRIDVFLDRMCSRVKYKSVHKELKKELYMHIEETAEEYESFGYNHDNAYSIAVSHMGNAFETGEEFNRHYRLPFDRSDGLALWSAIVTAVIYFAYPIIYKIYNRTIPVPYSPVFITALIMLFAIGNVMYLRRGRLKVSFRDFAYITAGFFVGWGVSIAVLMLWSAFTRYGYYPYLTDVKILFAPLYAPLLPKDQMVFGMEYFCWWFCLMTYLISVKSRKKIKPFTLVAGWFNLDDGTPMEDESLLLNGYDEKGNKIRMMWLYVIGETRNKYGERIFPHHDNDN